MAHYQLTSISKAMEKAAFYNANFHPLPCRFPQESYKRCKQFSNDSREEFDFFANQSFRDGGVIYGADVEERTG